MANAKQPFSEFLYMDPDSGMTVSMILDGDGFRPATAQAELASVDPVILAKFNADAAAQGRLLMSEAEETNGFAMSFEHAFGDYLPNLAPSA